MYNCVHFSGAVYTQGFVREFFLCATYTFSFIHYWISSFFTRAVLPLNRFFLLLLLLLLLYPQWPTVDADFNVPPVENPELTEALPLKSGVGQNIAMHVHQLPGISSLS